ncbi:MAG: YbaN family protein [Longimicrobiales bacterium]|nr:YbaN family protein [Longimicrobiales bacterium]
MTRYSTEDEAPGGASSSRGRWLFVSAGWGALGLGAVGVVLPVIPTTPFVLVAAWCFARSSERLHRRLLEHRTFGPLVREWEDHGVIPLRAKVLSTAMLVPVVAFALLSGNLSLGVQVATAGLAAAGLLFVWSRPSGV